MFVDNGLVEKFGGEERHNRFAIASTMFDASFKGAACIVIESQMLQSYDGCNLKILHRKIDEVVEAYKEETTVATNSFNFEN